MLNFSIKKVLVFFLFSIFCSSKIFAYTESIYHVDFGFSNSSIDNISGKKFDGHSMNAGIGMSSFMSKHSPYDKRIVLGFVGNAYLLSNIISENKASSSENHTFLDLVYLLALGFKIRLWKTGVLGLSFGADGAFSLGGRGLWQWGLGGEINLRQALGNSGLYLSIGTYLIALPLQVFSGYNDSSRMHMNFYIGVGI